MKAPAIAPRELLVLCAGGLTLAFSAWGLSGIKPWSLHVLLIGGLLTFLLSIMPMPLHWNGTDGQHGTIKNFKRLRQFPVFWLSLIFTGYLLIQGLNSSWVQLQNEHGWWIEKIDSVRWLPSSVEAHYRTMNVFRVMASFCAAYLLACGLWVGLQRRVSIILLLWIFVISSVSMAIVAILQKFTGAKAVLWSIPSPNPQFWGTFFYRNEAVAYLTLAIGICSALYFHHYNRSETRGISGGPHLLLFIFIIILGTSIALALSRGGIIFGGLMLICFLGTALSRWIWTSVINKAKILAIATALLLGGGAYTLLRNIDIEAIKTRFGDIDEMIEMADSDSRVLTSKITWEMFKEESWFGWGAGSWRYVFPLYQRNYPEIYYIRYDRQKGWIGRRAYYYAHNDILQFLCEYGIVGCTIIMLIFLYWIWVLLTRTSENKLSVLMLLTCILIAFGHAIVDFILQSPAYWAALHGTLCVSVKLLVLDTKRLDQAQSAHRQSDK